MNWLECMNNIVEYIEVNLYSKIDYVVFSKMLCCSISDFSRIFSFVAGVSASEYIRRRRLSQAALDIQSGKEKIIDVALKYGYKSQSAFTRAFKEMHGQTPLSVRQNGVTLKIYPKISFSFILKGMNEMNVRIEKKDSFTILGYPCIESNTTWREFMESYHDRLLGGGNRSYYTAPFWQVGAYAYEAVVGEMPCIIGAEWKDGIPVFDDMGITVIPAATWAVFTIESKFGLAEAKEAYTRIHSEWFPISNHKRNKSAPHLEVCPNGDTNSEQYQWEIWMPIV